MKTLTQQFAEHFRLDDPIRRASAAVPEAGQLKQLVARAAAATLAGPCPCLTSESRQGCAARRHPILAEVLLQCAESLKRRPECTAETGVSPQICLDARARDAEATALADAAGAAASVAGDAVRLIASDAAGAGEPILRYLAGAILRDDGPVPTSELRCTFSGALRAHEGEGLRAEAARARARDAAKRSADLPDAGSSRKEGERP